MVKSCLTKKKKKTRKAVFVDVFAGCGGLSLGLLKAGWIGKFAIEKNGDAFNTLAKNLIDGKYYLFEWPNWLPKKPSTTANLLAKYGRQLARLRGKVDLLAGAPPCQGFSLAGRRLHSDPRNSLFKQYLSIVKKIEPRVVLVENVQGFSFPFKKNGNGRKKHRAYSEVLSENLQNLGYTVFAELVNFSQFGVPQNRKRFILIAIRNGDSALRRLKGRTPFEMLRLRRMAFLRSKNLRTSGPVSTRQAIADLEINGRSLVNSSGQPFRGFKEIRYPGSWNSSRFVRLMRRHSLTALDSIRLPRHKSRTVRQFRRIMATCRKGQSLNENDRRRLGIKKRVLTPLHARRPASTVTTLPDDMIHYSEPRVLSVRENARLQTFPDWFVFTGKYTTGSKDRRRDCPRYTQVGNAVPPLFAEAMGLVLKNLSS